MNNKKDRPPGIAHKSNRFLYKLVHHYCNEKYLFQTITMYPEAERDQIMANMVDNKSWNGGRFAEQNRGTYLQRRIRAEEQMYKEFSRKYWVLKECCPVYFYLYPHFSLDEI